MTANAKPAAARISKAQCQCRAGTVLPMLNDTHRIYFDGNEGTADGRYGLWLNKSRADLAKIPGGPQKGMVFTIYMVGEIEAEATLEWCGEPWNAWTARVIGEIRSNNETWDDDA